MKTLISLSLLALSFSSHAFNMRCNLMKDHTVTIAVGEQEMEVNISQPSHVSIVNLPITLNTSTLILGRKIEKKNEYTLSVNRIDGSVRLGFKGPSDKNLKEDFLKCDVVKSLIPQEKVVNNSFTPHSVNEERLSGCVWGSYNIQDKYKKVNKGSVQTIVNDCKSRILTANWEQDPTKPDLGNFSPGCVLGVSAGFLSMKSSIDLSGMTQQRLMSVYREICMGVKPTDLKKLGHRT